MCGVVCAIDKQTCTRPAQKLFINVRLMSESQALCLSLSKCFHRKLCAVWLHVRSETLCRCHTIVCVV